MRFVRPFQAAWRFFKRPRVFDTTLVAVLAGIAAIVVVVALVNPNPVLPAAAHFLVSTLPLLVRRRRPLVAAAAVTVLDAIGLLTGIANTASIPESIAYYSVGRYTSGRTTAIATAVGALVFAVVYQVAMPGPGSWFGGMVAPLIMVGIGQFVRLRHELQERRERERADNAVRAERRRIARELHDVVAHHLSVVNALVGGARATLPKDQGDARDALSSAEQTTRQALAEMRQLLDVLRADEGDGADASTGVGAARLPALIEEARTAGLPASLTVTGSAVTLPAAVDHAVYRIVQEALTNTRKHARGARATVCLAYEPGAVEVLVLDDGVAGPAGTPGFGLGGMAERVALSGGQLQTGPRPEGGFRVHARIPLEKP
ncbi:sensor histidine kinase [Nonomuraea sp. NPDC050536]|uniref:sensor histidine kinase n=1 Tax=Nonomuraea sp. NPDC050536 TaxID=3364366 RepID=UPI0037CB78CE